MNETRTTMAAALVAVLGLFAAAALAGAGPAWAFDDYHVRQWEIADKEITKLGKDIAGLEGGILEMNAKLGESPTRQEAEDMRRQAAQMQARIGLKEDRIEFLASEIERLEKLGIESFKLDPDTEASLARAVGALESAYGPNHGFAATIDQQDGEMLVTVPPDSALTAGELEAAIDYGAAVRLETESLVLPACARPGSACRPLEGGVLFAADPAGPAGATLARLAASTGYLPALALGEADRGATVGEADRGATLARLAASTGYLPALALGEADRGATLARLAASTGYLPALALGEADRGATPGHGAARADGIVGHVMAAHTAERAGAQVRQPGSGNAIGAVQAACHRGAAPGNGGLDGRHCDPAFIRLARNVQGADTFTRDGGGHYAAAGRVGSAAQADDHGAFLKKPGSPAGVTYGMLVDAGYMGSLSRIMFSDPGGAAVGDSGAPELRQPNSRSENVELHGMFAIMNAEGPYAHHRPQDHMAEQLSLR